MFNKILRKIIIFSCIFCLLAVVCIPRKKAHAIAPVVAVPVFASAVGGVTVVSAAAAFGIVALVGAGCYGVYKLSQPSVQQSIKDWASSQVEAFQAGKTDWGVYVDSKGNYFMDNADKLRADFNSKFNPDDQTKKDKDMFPAFPATPSTKSNSGSGHAIFPYYDNLTDQTAYVTVVLTNVKDWDIKWNSKHNPASNTFTLPAQTKMVIMATTDSNGIPFSESLRGVKVSEFPTANPNDDSAFSFLDNTCNWCPFQIDTMPYISSVVLGDKTEYKPYNNTDSSFPIPTEFPDISKSIQLTPSVDPTTVTKDSDLTKVKPVTNEQVKPTQATEPNSKTKPNTTDDTKPDTTDSSLPDSVSIDFKPIEHAGEEFTNKFPFCLPWDIARSFSDLNSIKGTAPKWNIQFPRAVFGADAGFVIDFAQFEKFAIIIRWGLTALFIVCLIWGTRKIIGS